jgi:hypothetical protein
MKKDTKVLLLSLIILIAIGSAFNTYEKEPEANTEDNAPSEPITFEDRVFQDLQEEGIYDVLGIGLDEDVNYLIIRISPGYTADHGLFQRTVSRTTFDIMQAVVAKEYNVSGVMVYAETNLMNNKGNSVTVKAYEFQTSMKEAKTVNWENLRWTDDPLRYAEANAEYFYLNPALV